MNIFQDTLSLKMRALNLICSLPPPNVPPNLSIEVIMYNWLVCEDGAVEK